MASFGDYMEYILTGETESDADDKITGQIGIIGAGIGAVAGLLLGYSGAGIGGAIVGLIPGLIVGWFLGFLGLVVIRIVLFIGFWALVIFILTSLWGVRL